MPPPTPALGREPQPAGRPIGGHGRGGPGLRLPLVLAGLLAVLLALVVLALPRWVESRTPGETATDTTGSNPGDQGPNEAGEAGATDPGLDDRTAASTTAAEPEFAEHRPNDSGVPAGSTADLAPEGPRPESTRWLPGTNQPAASQSIDAHERLMSEGYRALAEERWDDAQQAFDSALIVRPGAPGATNGLAQAKTGQVRDAIDGHRRNAEQFSSAERWHEALREFNAILALDATVRFAQSGRQQAADRAELSDGLNRYLAAPDRLGEPAVFEEASLLLERAAEIQAPGDSRLAEQRRSLARWLARAAIPVTVTIRSDRETEVTIYRIGRLGRFSEHSLEMHAGSYTVVGTRRGYRDVRLTLTVDPDQPPEPLEVLCRERL